MTTKILLVDDQEINLLYLHKTLSRLPHAEITDCGSADQALVLCETQQWDLIVADYMMPGMDGLEFIRQFRKMSWGQDTPVLMVTASSDRDVKYQLLDLGVVDFLQKPVDASELIARARNLISLHQATVSLTQHNQNLRASVREMTAELAARERESLMVLAKAAESRDPETGFHLLRMAGYSHQIALNLGLSESEAEQIFLAAPMHDVGKIAVPDRVLQKTEGWNEQEWQEMQKHTLHGFEILGHSSTPILNLGGIIALHHHEAWDGTGYPNGIRGEEIPLAARIVTVADYFESLTCLSPIKNHNSFEQAVEKVQAQSGLKLDPQCVAAFCASLDSIRQIMSLYADQ